jgi:hypothetical protein
MGLGFEADSTEAAIELVKGISFPAGTTILGMTPIPDPVFFTNLPQTIEEDGGHAEEIEAVEPPAQGPIVATPPPNGEPAR